MTEGGTREKEGEAAIFIPRTESVRPSSLPLFRKSGCGLGGKTIEKGRTDERADEMRNGALNEYLYTFQA